jgi:hypothetical protein
MDARNIQGCKITGILNVPGVIPRIKIKIVEREPINLPNRFFVIFSPRPAIKRPTTYQST